MQVVRDKAMVDRLNSLKRVLAPHWYSAPDSVQMSCQGSANDRYDHDPLRNRGLFCQSRKPPGHNVTGGLASRAGVGTVLTTMPANDNNDKRQAVMVRVR